MITLLSWLALGAFLFLVLLVWLAANEAIPPETFTERDVHKPEWPR